MSHHHLHLLRQARKEEAVPALAGVMDPAPAEVAATTHMEEMDHELKIELQETHQTIGAALT